MTIQTHQETDVLRRQNSFITATVIPPHQHHTLPYIK